MLENDGTGRGREPLALVGVGCRFPGGADGPEAFWNLLLEGVDAVSSVPPDRWHPKHHHRLASDQGGFLDGVDRFDPLFFGISPREAARMDPQQRLLLEVAWEAMEDAGLPLDRVWGSRTGVFIGFSNRDYTDLQSLRTVGTHSSTGEAGSIAANRISYCFHLTGPSMVVDTACSSGLTATHLACQSLWNGECERALAGAVNLVLHPRTGASFTALSMLSPDGRCRAFDADGRGFVRGEGAGLVILRPLSAALADRDPVYAVILATGVNQDGHSSGMTVPSLQAQELLLREVYQRAGVAPAEVGFVEAHGPGTPVGDPIESRALAAVLGTPGRDLVLGSVKTNLGHLETAAGLAGLIKAALALRHGTVPPNLHFANPHPQLPAGLRVPTKPEPLRGRVVGVNSFGFGGANAHAVLGSPPPEPDPAPEGGSPQVLLLSGHTPEALRDAAASHAAWLEERSRAPEGPTLPDLAWTLAVRRTHQAHRLAVLGDTAADLAKALQGWLADAGGEAHAGRSPGKEPRPVAFLFTGQGSQWAGMGRTLLETEPAFRRTVEEVDRVIRAEGGFSVLEEILRPEEESGLRETALAQPAIFALQMGLVEVLARAGIRPAAALGHSIGEVSAACAAGVLTLEQAARAVYYRGRLMGTTRPGSMLAVGLSEAEVLPHLPPEVTVSAVTGPELVTLSGPPAAVSALADALDARGVFCRILDTGYAFHHAWMEPIRDDLLESLSFLEPRAARIPLVSSVTGDWSPGEEWDAAYQWRNVRQAVQFARGVDTLVQAGFRTFLEVGPHPALSRSVTDALDARGERGLAVPTLRRGEDGRLGLRRSLARLHVNGFRVDWEAVLPAGRVVRTPATPWQRERCWVEDEARRRERLEPPAHPLLGLRRDDPEDRWEAEVSLRSHPWLADHRLGEHPLMPAAAFLELALAAARGPGDTLEAEGVELSRALFLGDEPADLRVARDGDRFTVSSRHGEGWVRHASGRARARDCAVRPPATDLAALKARLPEHLDPERLFADFRRRGLHYGPAFQGLREAWVGPGEALGRVEAPVAEDGWLAHPALLDSCLQATLLLLPPDGPTRLPVKVGLYRRFGHLPSELYVHVRDSGATLLDGAGEPVALLEGLEFRPLEEEAAQDRLLYRHQWEEAPSPEPARAGRWRILADRGGVAPRLEQALRDLGHEVGDDGGVVDLRPLDPGDDLAAGLGRMVDLVRELAGSPRRLVAVTRRARVEPAASALWGLVRTAASEHPELRPLLVDLDGQGDDEVAALAREIAAGAPEARSGRPAPPAGHRLVSEETEVALRGNRRLVHRLHRTSVDELAREALGPCPGPARLAPPRSGVLEDLAPVAFPGPEPGPGEVAVEVRAAGVNFSDVLKAMGLYPGTPGGALDMGLELSGVVRAIGPGVEGLRPGAPVMGLARRGGALGTQVLTTPDMLAPIPEGLSFAEAAAVPVAFLTAWYALWRMGRLAPGETVLVHSASGGVGLAALEMARWTGASVVATAGSKEKREFLRGLGVEHVFDSRALDFARQAREATGGRGVDLVLNSLAGEALAAGLEALAPGGRFLELGKRDIYEDTRVGLRPLRNNLTFCAVDLEQVIKLNPEVIAEGLRVVVRGFREGRLRLPPVRVLPFGEAPEAFRTLAAARHVGKLVLAVQPESLRAVPDPDRVPVPADRTCLVVGGLGGFGREAARWLVDRGARRLALVGRRGRATPGAAELEAELRARGAEVEILQADVGDSSQAAELVERCQPLGGVLHAAMVLDDAPLRDLDAERLRTVLRPKADGAWNLHRLTEGQPLDFFVTFSSVAALFGNPGQAAYCAANAFLDGLAALRRARGLPALSVQWGAVGDAGWLVDHEALRHHVEGMGMRPLRAAEALEAMGSLMAVGSPPAVVARVDWPRLARALGGPRPVFGHLVGSASRRGPAAAEAGSLLQRLRDRLAAVVGVPPERLDPARPLTDLGLDSLMMFEVRNWLSDALGVAVSAAELLKGPTLEELASSLAGRMETEEAPAASVASEDPAPMITAALPAEEAPRNGHAVVAVPGSSGNGSPRSPWGGLEDLPGFLEYQERRQALRDIGLEHPYFRVVEGLNSATCTVDGRRVLNFCSYNYLGLAGHPEVDAAAREAIERHGTSVSASRLAAGERALHRDLETEVARFLGTEDAMVLVSGHATNTGLVPHLVGPGDLVLHDSLIHNSALQGAMASRATRRAFPHGDLEALDRILEEQRARHRLALVLVEGLYSMDGDFPDLGRLLELKERHRFLLLVDEAHSLGVLGATGRGLAEEAGLPRAGDVIWMGTLSKALASCGGYLAGPAALIDYLKHSLGGFVFSVGMPPASAAAALAALRLLQREPERVRAVRQRSEELRQRLQEAGFDVGLARGAAVVPVIVGDPQRCMVLSQRLWEEGVNVSPAVWPAVAPDQSRLRFFVTAEHTSEHLARAVEVLQRLLPLATAPEAG